MTRQLSVAIVWHRSQTCWPSVDHLSGARRSPLYDGIAHLVTSGSILIFLAMMMPVVMMFLLVRRLLRFSLI